METQQYSIPKPEVGAATQFTQRVFDKNSRRWIFSAALTLNLGSWTGGRYVGYSEIPARTFTPIETVTALCPQELPAKLLSGEDEYDLENTFLPFNTVHQSMGIVRSAEQCAGDITWAYDNKGVAEIEAFRGMDASQVEKITNVILPPAKRVTLKQMLSWLDFDADSSLDSLPESLRESASQALSKIREAAISADIHLTTTLESSETEVEARRAGGKGKARLDEFDKFCLKELERKPRELAPVEANEKLGSQLASGVVQGIKEALTQQPSQAVDYSALQEQIAELQKQLTELKKPAKAK